MGRIYGPVWPKSLQGSGYLGSLYVDFRDKRFFASGRAANAFGLLQKQGASGVDMKVSDSAVHPDDLARLEELRASYVGSGGRRSFRERVRNKFRDGPAFTWIEAQYSVQVDAFGLPVSASGIVLDLGTLMDADQPATVFDDLNRIIAELKQSDRMAQRRGMLFLSREITQVVETAQEIAVNRLLE